MGLERGGQVPHFTVTVRGGALVRYADIWQRKNLLLVTLPDDPSPETDGYASEIDTRLSDLISLDAAVVVTTDAVDGMRRPGVLIADRWGEVILTAAAPASPALPAVDELIEWLRFVQVQCPECQGETR